VPQGAVSAKRVYDWLYPSQSKRALQTENQKDSAKSDPQVLLIDLRPADQFEDSHIKHPSCINVPADVIQPG
jgi:rhodanese-related sulfurtransferase